MVVSNTEFDHSYLNKLVPYACFNSLLLFAISINIIAFGGLFYYPFTVVIYFVLPYFTYTLMYNRPELKEGTRWRIFSENFFVFRTGRKYLQMQFQLPKALQEAEKDADAQFIFALFPHGTGADYRILMDGMLHDFFPNTIDKIRYLSASVLFKIPVIREIALWTGCVDARKAVAEGLLNKGYSCFVLPGGEAEQIRTVYQEERIFLKNRKGFVKLSMSKGVPIVPVYVFGASDYYYTSHTLFGPHLWLQKSMRICIPFASGLWGSGICPLPVKTTIVFGEPLNLKLKKSGSPTKEELDAGHEEFCKSLLQLFNSKKHELGYGDRSLDIH